MKPGHSMPVFDPEQLIGRSFLLDETEDGERLRARIFKLIEDHESSINENPTRIMILLAMKDDTLEGIIRYNQMLEYIERDDDSQTIWKFNKIVSHQGPLSTGDVDYRGSSYNVMIAWENGEITSEPLSMSAADDPVTCALELDGLKRFKSLSRREMKFDRMVNQAKLRSFNNVPRFQYGFEVPKDYAHAIRLDERNGNTHWRDATALELLQIDEFETFEDLGHKDTVRPLSEFKKIRVHLDRAKRIYWYLSKMKHAIIRFRKDEPDYSDLPIQEFDWSKSVYGDSKESIPHDATIPLGEWVTLSHYVDANLMHDMVSGKSVAGILHLANKTSIGWFFEEASYSRDGNIRIRIRGSSHVRGANHGATANHEIPRSQAS